MKIDETHLKNTTSIAITVTTIRIRMMPITAPTIAPVPPLPPSPLPESGKHLHSSVVACTCIVQFVA